MNRGDPSTGLSSCELKNIVLEHHGIYSSVWLRTNFTCEYDSVAFYTFFVKSVFWCDSGILGVSF